MSMVGREWSYGVTSDGSKVTACTVYRAVYTGFPLLKSRFTAGLSSGRTTPTDQACACASQAHAGQSLAEVEPVAATHKAVQELTAVRLIIAGHPSSLPAPPSRVPLQREDPGTARMPGPLLAGCELLSARGSATRIQPAGVTPGAGRGSIAQQQGSRIYPRVASTHGKTSLSALIITSSQFRSNSIGLSFA